MPTAHTPSPWQRARKALNQWLDGADTRRSSAVFVVGGPREGVAPLAMALDSLPQVWTWPSDSVAFRDAHLRPPDVIEGLLWTTPADVVIFPAAHEARFADRFLAVHDDSRVLWLARPWHATAAERGLTEGVRLRDALSALAHESSPDDRLPERLRSQLAELGPRDLSPTAAAALAWYVEHSFFFALGLDRDPRALLVRTDELAHGPDELTRVLAFLSRPAPETLPTVQATTADVNLPDVGGDVEALCDLLQARLWAAWAAQG